MLADATNYVKNVDNVMIYIVAISVVFLLGITFAMIYFVVKYNRKKHPKAENIEGNIWLEALWVAVPTILALSMFYYGFTNFKIMRRVPKDSMVVKVTGQMWQWSFTYPNGKKHDTLYVPVNKNVKLELISMDVTHAFYIPAFRIKEDVVPGQTTYLVFNAQKQGNYDVECAEYCGLKHSYMLNKVVVIPQNDFQAWLDTPVPTQVASSAPAQGQKASGDSTNAAKGENSPE